jgi:hypothetical protein
MVSQERGQVLLMGALLVAIALIGTIVFINGMLFTVSADTGSDGAGMSEATEIRQAINDDIRAMVRSISRDGPADFEAALLENVSTYSRHYANTTASGDPAYVNVSVDTSESEGLLLRQTSAAKYRAEDNSQDWALVDDNNASGITQFDLTVTNFQGVTDNSAFYITVADASGSAFWMAQLYKNQSTSTYRLNTRNQSTAFTEQCSGFAGDQIDLLAGEVAGCEFPTFLDEFDGPYTIRFEDGHKATGTYQIAVGSANEGNFAPGQVQPSLVRPAVRVVYDSPDLRFDSTRVLNTSQS